MKTLKFAFFFLLTTAIWMSCEKTENPAQIETNYKTGPCNEYDIAGQIHNEGLAYLLSFEAEWNQISNEEELAQFIMTRGSEYATSVGGEPFTYQRAYAIATNANGEDDVQNSSVLSNYDKSVLLQFIGTINSVDFSDAESLDNFHSNAQSLECAVMNDPAIYNLPVVLGAISVGNRSVEFWSAYQTEKMKPGNEKAGDIDWQKVGIADLEGFVGGGGITSILSGDMEGLLNAAIDGLASSAKELSSQKLG